MKKLLEQHFLENIEIFNRAVFENGQENISLNERTEKQNVQTDLVYFDPLTSLQNLTTII